MQWSLLTVSQSPPDTSLKSLPDFQKAQFEFTSHIRDPEHNARPEDVPDRRMQVYRELFYNNLQNFVANGFPVLRKISSDDYWHRLVRAFFAEHRCHSPYFMEISEEFVDYLQNVREPTAEDFPFLAELAHYERQELVAMVAPENIDELNFDKQGSLLNEPIVVSPLSLVLAYEYPVHRIGPAFIPDAPGEQPTFLVVTRDQQHRVSFTEINALTYRLLELLRGEPLSGTQALERIAAELNHPQPELILAGGREILGNLLEKQIVLGTEISR